MMTVKHFLHLISNKDFYVLVFVLAGLAGWSYNGTHNQFDMTQLLAVWAIPASVYIVKSTLNSAKGEEPK